MLIPINTDTPVYHFPWVTISLIVSNVAAFAAWIAAGHPSEWMLNYGNGLHPLQWVSSVFLHDGILHLAGNMVFLWGFGLIVEGKIGWWRYLVVYLGIAVVSCLIEQTMMLGYHAAEEGEFESSLGASGVIFGLMAISLVWAPRNEMSVFMLLLYRAFVFEASILAFCGWYFALQVLTALFDWSSVLHLLGAAVGGIVGVVMLKKGWVDCEGWDLFAVMNNTHGRRDEYDEFRYRVSAFQEGTKISTPRAEPEQTAIEKHGKSSLDPRVRVGKFLEAGDVISALGEYEKLVAFHPTWRLDRETLAALGEAAYREKLWEDAEPLLRQYLDRFANDNSVATLRIRFKLAKALIDGVKNPADGFAVLCQIDPTILPPKAAAAYHELRKRTDAVKRLPNNVRRSIHASGSLALKREEET